MTSLRILGVAALAFVISTPHAMAQTRGGGAVSGGIREAVSDGIIGVSEAAGTGAKTGVVTEATRAAIDREKQARARYQNTAEYRNAQHSDFAKARADAGADLGKATKSGVEAVIRKHGKLVAGITFPAGWNQRDGGNAVSAVSPDGQLYCWLVAIKTTSRADANRRLMYGLKTNYLDDIKSDEPKEKGGATLITGTGKGKKSGVDVVFATGVFEVGDQIVAAMFMADSKIEDYYKETIRGICQTIRPANDLAQ
ncbi:MAG TPA: hypothetical protein VG055_18560 [Planctomycetaceae bacterium]|jgi:hypothetical protein|nr:hypothetical protein [Planctomycetaceae bacterium]